MKMIYTFNSNVINITFQGDAHSLPEGLQLTRDSGYENSTYSVGRALHHEQVHLWDNSTGWLADFKTQFSFNIKSIHEVSGDGHSFIAPFGSDIPENSAGRYLGLISYGIDVNSINSSVTFSQLNFRPAISALVRYNSTTKKLSVFLTSSAENFDLNWNYILSSKVDLRTVLSEWVNVGFFAATGEFNQSYTILSWSFNSSLREEGIHGNTLPNKKNVLVLGIGFAVGLVAVMSCGLVLLWFICWRKNESGRIEEFIDDMCMNDEICAGTVPRRFTYLELSCATNNFVEEGKLGEGGFGGV
ncbi:agglutinin-2 [Quercus suber]|uniref:Agglutinin-2 n=1 Tax=Quercus suber TaxID=58331 RepID=A0AAW0LNB6_QUESU